MRDDLGTHGGAPLPRYSIWVQERPQAVHFFTPSDSVAAFTNRLTHRIHLQRGAPSLA